MFFKGFDSIYYQIILFFGNFTAFDVKSIYNNVKIMNDFRNFDIVKRGFTIFQKDLLWEMLYTLMLLQKFLFVSFLSLTQKLSCLLYAS